MRIRIVESLLNLLESVFQIRVSRYLSRNINQSSRIEYIFDVGANRGTISKAYLRLFPGARIIAIEPLPIFKIESEQIEWMQVALSEKEGKGEFFICRHMPSSSLILPNSKSNWNQLKAKILGLKTDELYQEIQIEISTIDKINRERNIESVLLLKIDTEGSEFYILKGALKSLRSGVIKNVQIESQSNDFRESHRGQILNIMESCSFVHKKSMRHLFGNFKEEFFTLTKDA